MEEARCGPARLKVEDAAAGAVAAAAAPQGLSDYRPRGLSTQEGCNLAVKLEQPAEVISAPFQVIGQIAEDGAVAGSVPAAAPQMGGGLTDFNPWGLSTEEDEEKGCNLAVKLERSAEVPFQVTGQIGEDGAVAVTVPAAAPQAGDGLSDYKPWGLATEEGCSLAVKLEEQSVEVPFQVTGQIGEDKGSRMDDRPMNMDDDKFLAESGEAAESGSLKMRPVANAGLSSKALDVTCGGVVDKDTERSHYERKAGLAGNRGDWAGMPEVMTSKGGLKMVSEVAHCDDNEGLSDSAKHATERWPRGVDGIIFMADGNYDLQQDDSMPKTETKVSVPSVSGRVDDSSNGKADRVGEISGDPVTDGRGDCLLPKIQAKVSSPAHEDSVPSTFGSNLAVSLDGKAGEIGEVSEHKSGMEKVACCSLGGGMQSCDSGFLKQESLGDDIQFSRMDGCHENRGLGHQDSSGVKLGCPNHLALELNGCKSVIDKPCSAVFVENGNDEELGIQKSESSSVSRRRNPRRSASARNPTLEKHDQISKGGNSTCKSKKVESSCSLVESIMINFPNKTTKVRTGINRPLKSTAWGSLQKLTCGFGQNCEPSTSNSHLISLENGRSRKRSGKKEQPSTQKTRSSRCSKKKFPPFSANGFAPDELNGQPTVSVTACTYASSEGYKGKFPRLDHHGLVNGSDDTHKNAECMSIQTGLQQLGRCLESVTQETCSAYICGDFAKSTSEPSLNIAGVGFSPDSVLEVASATCENDTFANHDAKLRGNPSHPAAFTENGFHASALSTSDSVKNHASASADLEQWAHTVRSGENTRNEDSNLSRALLGYIGEGKVQVVEKSNAAKKSKKVGKQERQKKDGMKGKNIKDRGSTKIPSERRAFSDDSCSLVPSVAPKFGSCFEVVTSATRSVTMHEHDSMQGPSVIRKEKTSALDNVKSPRRRKNGGSGGKKDTMRDPYVKGKNMNKNISGDIFFDSGSSTSPSRLVTDLATSHTNEQNNRNPATESSFENSAVVSTGIPLDSACIKDGTSVPQPPRAAWVCCDDCQKWRCIPADLADIIGKTNCRWTCKDNQNKTFADCSIQQEKTNAEINAELDLSDASADEADNDGSNSKASKAPSWTHARINSFLHRNRRNQSVDESMVCNCKPPQDGRMGCRDGCLNRMLNIECEKRTCPCGEQCSNQQFQRRSYAKISWFHSGKKGYGLQLQEEVSEGRFLIEYVGEVLDITAYEARQSYYASKGQKHFYFMALNGGEVIDACTKGNLGRFINHSCSPNCRTEKWMVNGEVCIGIFAMRNIKKGEELTFDYNYVRVSGAAPQKCFCGTAKCRGYIGGDMSGSGIIAQDDAEAGHFEPVVTYKDAEEMLGNAYYSHGANLNIVEHETSIQREDSNNCPPATPDSELHQQTLPILSDTSEPNNSIEAWSPQDAEDVTRTPVHVSQTIESSLQLLPVYGNQPLECLEKTPNTTDELTDPNVMNRSTPSSDLRSSLVPGSHAKKKNSLKHHRNVKPPCLIDNEHTLGVEGRLNSLLDRDGGISRRKDSTHEYLRLLVLTAADGDAGGTSKSIRDLALILEALLQTKSGAVLLDIINMNGLQMLHNILKQNRDHFLRRPIIRKLLKVLEFLALRGILTAEKINEGPRRAGMESFRDSMLKLTRHSDKHVHPIARKFCDKWILPYMDGPANCSTYSYSSRRKRKSRWDYQPESHYKMAGLQIAKVYSGHGQLDLQTSSIINRSHGNWVTNSNHNDVPIIGRSTDGADDDVPPGFEPQQKRQPAQASLDCGIAPGFCQGMYLPISSISYGIPIAIVQHFGTPEVEGTQCGKKWKVAPGVPFNPFPPVSTYPQGSPCRPPTSSTQISRHDGASTMGHNSSAYRGRGADRGGRVHRNWRNGERTRYPYDHQGRRFPSNHHRLER